MFSLLYMFFTSFWNILSSCLPPSFVSFHTFLFLSLLYSPGQCCYINIQPILWGCAANQARFPAYSLDIMLSRSIQNKCYMFPGVEREGCDATRCVTPWQGCHHPWWRRPRLPWPAVHNPPRPHISVPLQLLFRAQGLPLSNSCPAGAPLSTGCGPSGPLVGSPRRPPTYYDGSDRSANSQDPHNNVSIGAQNGNVAPNILIVLPSDMPCVEFSTLEIESSESGYLTSSLHHQNLIYVLWSYKIYFYIW